MKQENKMISGKPQRPVALITGGSRGIGWAGYVASKHYVLAFTRGLARELKGMGVTATALCPGTTATDFVARSDVATVRAYRWLPKVSVENVARAGYRGAMKAKTTVVPGLLILSFILAMSSFREFARARNPVPPNQPIQELMTGGPFRFSRNPLYLAVVFLHGGVAFVSGNAWILLTLPLSLLVVRYYVIVREEAYLIRRFDQTYLDYMARVRRWF